MKRLWAVRQLSLATFNKLMDNELAVRGIRLLKGLFLLASLSLNDRFIAISSFVCRFLFCYTARPTSRLRRPTARCPPMPLTKYTRCTTKRSPGRTLQMDKSARVTVSWWRVKRLTDGSLLTPMTSVGVPMSDICWQRLQTKASVQSTVPSSKLFELRSLTSLALMISSATVKKFVLRPTHTLSERLLS